MNIQIQIEVIKKLFTASELCDIPLWLGSGWAIDARLGEITREHGDIDIAFPSEKREEYITLLVSIGFSNYEELDYGFLMSRDNILIDSEPCLLVDGKYMPDGFPEDSCPFEKEGSISEFKVRCMSWDAMYFEFLYYANEVVQGKWQKKDAISLEIVKKHIRSDRQNELKQLFDRNRIT
ncbi:MAG: aminoglycoside nucleotidyltransferase [Calditrichaeota bacterium]|nr:aminoglycoside nucleotidyltransferase [Calditrichota bacterium]